MNKNALLKAACRGDAEIVRHVIPHCDVNRRDKKGGTALMYASLYGNEASVDTLLMNGGDVSLTCVDGWTPLMYAASKGHAHICRALLAKGARADVEDVDGLSVLMIAVQRGHAGTCKVGGYIHI